MKQLNVAELYSHSLLGKEEEEEDLAELCLSTRTIFRDSEELELADLARRLQCQCQDEIEEEDWNRFFELAEQHGNGDIGSAPEEIHRPLLSANPPPTSIQDLIRVYTPEGEPYCFARGATVLDLAYHIHTDIGNKCTGAVFNDRFTAKPSNRLLNNTVVKILTGSTVPDLDWIDIVKTSKARRFIKNQLHRQYYWEDVQSGDRPVTLPNHRPARKSRRLSNSSDPDNAADGRNNRLRA